MKSGLHPLEGLLLIYRHLIVTASIFVFLHVVNIFYRTFKNTYVYRDCTNLLTIQLQYLSWVIPWPLVVVGAPSTIVFYLCHFMLFIPILRCPQRFGNTQTWPLMLYSHRFLWPPLLLPPFTVPYRMVFDRPEDLETWPYHLSFLLLTVVSKSSYGSNYMLDPVAYLLICDVLCIRYVKESSVASHFHFL